MKHADKDISPKDYDSYWKNAGVFVDERVKEIASLCPPGDLSVIDLGGGSGGLAKKLGALVVDWSPVACEMARKEGVFVICENILDFLEDCDAQYDLVILADVLEEMKMSETAALLDGIRKICRKYFVLSTPTHENYLNISTHQVIYSKEELLEMLTKRGFKKEAEVNYPDRLVARFARV